MSVHLKTIKGLPENIRATPYYQNKRPSIQPVFIDKCNWLINSIIIGNKHYRELYQFEPVPLNKLIIRKQLGNKESTTIINLLEEMDIIMVDRSYLSSTQANITNRKRELLGIKKVPVKAVSMKYGLTDKAKMMGLHTVPILSERMEKKFRIHKEDLLKKYLEDKQIHRKIIFNLTEIYFDFEKARPILNKVLVNKNSLSHFHYQDCFNTLCTFNNLETIEDYIGCSQFHYTQAPRVNRVFHYFSNVPKVFRHCLSLKDGSGMSEIDLRNSQPLLMSLKFVEDNPTSSCSILEDVLSGNFYQSIAEKVKAEGDIATYNLYLNDYSAFKALVLGEGLFYFVLPKNGVKAMEKHLTDMYPCFMKYIRNKKISEGYKSPSIEAQRLESDIFIRDLFISLHHGEFAVPIHDSILVKRAEVNLFMEKLVTIFETRFPHLSKEIITKLFSIKHFGGE